MLGTPWRTNNLDPDRNLRLIVKGGVIHKNTL